MTKDSNFEDLTEEELAELLDKEEDDMLADETHDDVDSNDAIVYHDEKEEGFNLGEEAPKSDNKSIVKEEIEVQSLKQQRK
jgi:hypothetical protein